MSFCPQCGAATGAAAFCGNCGAASGAPTAPAAGVAPAAVGVAVPSGGVETIPTAVPYSVGANTSSRDPWEKFSWASLPQEYKNNWITLGYDQRSWDGVAPLPKALNCTFAQLSPDQQRAAGFLGYARNMWDNDSKMIHPDPLPPLSFSGQGTANPPPKGGGCCTVS